MSNKSTPSKKHKLLKIFIVLILIILVIILYSRFISTKGLTVKEYKITNELITDEFHGFKIAHISDIHYGRTVKEKELKQIVDKINLLKPDIVVLTGDLFDKDIELNEEIKKGLIETLKNIDVTISKFAIRGNHDNYFLEWDKTIADSGFIDLNDKYETIYKDGYTPIILAGLSSNDIPINERYQSIELVVNSEENKDLYKILLIHEPDSINDINYSYFNTILAGHSHNGQVRLPFIGGVILPEGAKKYYDNYYKLNNTNLYISSGIGTSTINFRLFNRPSINFYRLTNK